MQTTYALEATNLTKRYQGKTALNHLNLQIKKGEVFCLLGQNGAGKTTTINLFLGFIQPTEGSTRVNGLDVATHGIETKKHLAYIPETVVLYPNLSGLENLDYFSSLARFSYRKEELTALLTQADLPREAVTQRVSTYSKGMRQKVGIAIALAKKAGALILDEPTSGLDPKASNEFTGLLRMLSKQGTAVLMATHDIFRAKEIGTRVGIMKEGNLVATLSAADITANDLEKLYLDYVHD